MIFRTLSNCVKFPIEWNVRELEEMETIMESFWKNVEKLCYAIDAFTPLE